MADSGIDWQTFDVASIASACDGQSLADALTKEMADIESQLDLADAKREFGEHVDPMWYAKAKAALKYRGRVHQIILRRCGDLNRASRQRGEAPRGCICPPTSEQTCRAPLCPRQPIQFIVT